MKQGGTQRNIAEHTARTHCGILFSRAERTFIYTLTRLIKSRSNQEIIISQAGNGPSVWLCYEGGCPVPLPPTSLRAVRIGLQAGPFPLIKLTVMPDICFSCAFSDPYAEPPDSLSLSSQSVERCYLFPS